MPDFIGQDPDLFAKSMLERGYFPENVPPAFKIRNLHLSSSEALESDQYLTDKPTEGARYNSTKRGGQRRIFTLPNPVFMIDAAKYFIKYRDQIEEHLSLSSDSCSYPQFDEDSSRPISITSFPEFHKVRRKNFALSRYVIRTDISRYFPSIYSHSLPWAIHGKTASKKDRKPDSQSIFGNRLDWLVRQAQDGQTVGIPVGPDFSRIVSEIIGTAVDRSFRKLQGADVPMVRLVDDIYIGSDNLDDAHTHLSAMRSAIRSFELDINENKTAILDASKDLELFWPVEIRREIERYSEAANGYGGTRTDFVHFLDEVLRLASNSNDDGIVKFALRKIDEHGMWTTYWDVLEPFLIRVGINFPHCWDYVARVVAWRLIVHDLDVLLWGRVVHKTVSQNVRNGNDSEVTWALWLLRQLGITLESSLFNSVLSFCGPLPCMLALDIYTNVGAQYKLPKDIILDKIGDTPMLGPNWILAYEADRQFGLKLKTKNVQGNSFLNRCMTLMFRFMTKMRFFSFSKMSKTSSWSHLQSSLRVATMKKL